MQLAWALKQGKIGFYPNPVNDQLTDQTIGIVSAVLLSLDGRTVTQSKSNGSNTIQVEVATLPAGIYFLLRTKADGNITTAKVLKN